MAQGLKVYPEASNSPTSILCTLFSWLKINSSSRRHYTFDFPGHCTHMCNPTTSHVYVIKKSNCENNYTKASTGASFRGRACTESLLQVSHLNGTAIQAEGSPVTQKSVEAGWSVATMTGDWCPPLQRASTWPAVMAQCTSHQAWWPELCPQNHRVDGSLQSVL